MATNKRKASGSHLAPMSVSAGLKSSEQAGQPGGAPSTAKRTKVDVEGVDEEDLTGDLDLQEQERKRLQQGRKGRVVTAGYDSDEDSDESEQEGEAEAGNGKIAGVDEDDEDMFNLKDGGALEGGNTDEGGKKPKKYLELGDIEGQEFGAVDTEEEERDAELELETDDEEYEVDEEEKEALHDADDVIQPLKKRKKGLKPGDKEDMGFQLDSFNMKNEMEAGRFDEDGNYIANAKDPHAEHDKWLSGNYSRKGIKAAKEAKEKRERERRAKEKDQDNAGLDEDECRMKLAELMNKGETVMEALQRLGAAVKRGHSSNKNASNESRNRSTIGKEREGQQLDQESSRQDLDQLTSLSSALMARFGKLNIYDETYEGLLRVVRRSGLVRETWDPAAARALAAGKDTDPKLDQEQDVRSFTYKWSPHYLAATSQSPNPEVEVFGPYSAGDLRGWYGSGYFGDQGERILLQESNKEEEGGSRGWKRWEQLF
jgi:CD2 antigen cytoplasmic tail-binding protein 2